MTSKRREKRRDYINPRGFSRRTGDLIGCGCGSQSHIIMKDAERKREGRGKRKKFINNNGILILEI